MSFVTVFLSCFTANQAAGLTYAYTINRLTGDYILSAVKTPLSEAAIGNRPFHTKNLLSRTYLHHMAVFFIAGNWLNPRLFLSRKKVFYKVYFDFWLQ